MTQSSHVPLESPEAKTDKEVSPLRGAYFPRRYLTDFFDFVGEHPNLEFITYDDFCWGDDNDFKRNYPDEHARWAKQLASGERDPSKAYIVVQYDVDARPDRTAGLLQDPAHRRVPANIMIFNRRIDRRRLKNTGEVAFTEYELGDELLREAQQRGCVVGYHTNAHEQALFDIEETLNVFDRDARELSEKYGLRYFSAHGGVPGPDGRNNRDMPFHPNWTGKLKWVHNGHSPYFDRQFSDGGHNSLKRDPEARDLRDFVRTIRPGDRCRVLLHPQYYDLNPNISPRFGETRWYLDLLEAAASKPAVSLWSNVVLGDQPASAAARATAEGSTGSRIKRWWSLPQQQKMWALRKFIGR